MNGTLFSSSYFISPNFSFVSEWIKSKLYSFSKVFISLYFFPPFDFIQSEQSLFDIHVFTTLLNIPINDVGLGHSLIGTGSIKVFIYN